MKTDVEKSKPKAKKSTFITVGSIIILILSAITFVFVPSMTRANPNKSNLPPFGKYDGKKIEYKYGSYFAKMVQQYGERQKQNNSQMNDSAYYQIFSDAFYATVMNMAINEEIKKSSYAAADSEINRTMLPYFYDESGKFSSKIFADTPDSRKIELREAIRDELTTTRYTKDVFGDDSTRNYSDMSCLYGLKVSAKEKEFISAMNNKQRSFEMVSFSTSNYPAKEAEAYGKENPDLFVKYDLSVVTVKTEDEANSLLKQLKNEEITFEDAVSDLSTKSYSDENGKVTDALSYQIKRTLTSDEDFDTISALAAGDYSPVTKVSNSYFAIFKCDGESVQPDFSKADTANEVLSYMKIYEAGLIEDYYVNIAKDFAADAAKNGFAKAASKVSAESKEIKAFPVNFSNNELLALVPSSSFAELTNAQTNENFLKAAFSLKENEISEPIVLGTNVIVLKFTEEVPADTTAETYNFSYPYYGEQFDEKSWQKAVFNSDKVENNVMSVFFSNFLNYDN